IAVGINMAHDVPGDPNRFIGYRVNPLAIRSRLRRQMTVADYLAQIKENLLDALEHRAVCVSSLSKKLKARKGSDNPLLISALFNLDRRTSRPNFEGLDCEARSNPRSEERRVGKESRSTTTQCKSDI